MSTAPVPRRSRLPWPFLPGFLPFWYAWLGGSWWNETLAAVRLAATELPGGTVTQMAAAALAARVLATLSEAGCYALWWKGRGTPLPFWRFFCLIASFSALDLVALTLGRAATAAPDTVRALAAVLAGSGRLEEPATTGAMAAFGSVGLLTVLRVALTGWAAARGTGRRLTGPLLLVACAWLLTRLTGWWAFDLARGMSPVR